MIQELWPPFDARLLLRRRKAYLRDLRQRAGLLPLRIAVLGGWTSEEVVNLLELFLLERGISPEFYQSDYNRYYEEAVLDPSSLEAFRPQIVYIHTASVNLRRYPPSSATESEFKAALRGEMERWEQIWSSLDSRLGCQLIQNNFDPVAGVLGNLDASSWGGRGHFVARMNIELAGHARANKRLLIHDLHGVATQLGRDQWAAPERWYSYKLVTTAQGSGALAYSLAALIGAVVGKSRKCLILDLDNTLWGGVIGDDGLEHIHLGRETPQGEAFTAFQEYCLELHRRGVLLAVCSKNEEEIARTGFQHPDSVLRLDHFAAICANWEPKSENIKAIAAQLNLGLDALVFVDDNPAERELIRAQLPEVAVPEVGSEVSRFADILNDGGYFEPVALSQEDLERGRLYATNAERHTMQARYADYGEYLQALEMTAEISPFRPAYLDRIAQLTNKTNQFNLTARRYNRAELEHMAADPQFLTFAGHLRDRFGDNGLVSVVIGRKDGRRLHLDLWLMSCRVLKRDMEAAMLDALVERASAAGIKEMIGYYQRTSKNDMVAEHYARLGFTRFAAEDPAGEASEWRLSLEEGYHPRNRYIRSEEISDV